MSGRISCALVAYTVDAHLHASKHVYMHDNAFSLAAAVKIQITSSTICVLGASRDFNYAGWITVWISGCLFTFKNKSPSTLAV